MDIELGKSVMLILASAMLLTSELLKKEPERILHHDSLLTGDEYFKEVMRTPSWRRFLVVTRISKNTFLSLLQLLRQHGGLRDSRGVCAGKRLMIFLSLLKGITVVIDY
jgi:hypothetical protein